jgi:hypothetical protein
MMMLMMMNSKPIYAERLANGLYPSAYGRCVTLCRPQLPEAFIELRAGPGSKSGFFPYVIAYRSNYLSIGHNLSALNGLNWFPLNEELPETGRCRDGAGLTGPPLRTIHMSENSSSRSMYFTQAATPKS